MTDEIDDAGLDQLVLISGFSGTGKSASLRNIRNQDKWLYLGTESGKRLPFKNSFYRVNVSDPLEVPDYLDEAIENREKLEGCILDSMTFLMDMYETQYVLNAANTQKAWGSFAQFFKTIMQEKVPKFGKPTIITAHLKDVYDEKTLSNKTYVPIKGSLAGNGVEAYFSTVVAAKKVEVKELAPFESELLTITDEERELGFKHVFQTRITKATVGERIRSPMGMFSKEQTYMDNDAQLLVDHLNSFYN